jgi:hypothetical protein
MGSIKVKVAVTLLTKIRGIAGVCLKSLQNQILKLNQRILKALAIFADTCPPWCMLNNFICTFVAAHHALVKVNRIYVFFS